MINEVQNIRIESLVPFANHPFRLYEGARLNEMVASIHEAGVMTPLLVRAKADGSHEILSGHNRANAAKIAGLEEVPCIVMDNLSDEEATLVVTESNFNQRSFADFIHSERAAAIKLHLDALKKLEGQGKRNDMAAFVFNATSDADNGDSEADFETSRQVGGKSPSAGKTGEQFGLSSRNVHRYVRLTYLIPQLLERVDANEIGLVPAVYLSYLSEEEQEILDRLASENNIKISLKIAKALNEKHGNLRNGELYEADILKVLKGKSGHVKSKNNEVKVPKRTFTKYFNDSTPSKEVVSTIEQALAFFFEAVERGDVSVGENESEINADTDESDE